jgi:hypothetical protein
MRIFNPELVEVVRVRQRPDAASATADAFAERLGKDPIAFGDMPNSSSTASSFKS